MWSQGGDRVTVWSVGAWRRGERLELGTGQLLRLVRLPTPAALIATCLPTYLLTPFLASPTPPRPQHIA